MGWVVSAVAGGVGLVYFGTVLADILSNWDKFRAKMLARGVELSRPVALALAGAMLAAALFASYLALAGYREEHPPLPDSVEAAQKFVVGTWTFTAPLSPDAPDARLWQRWVIRADGTADIYLAPPISDSWGNPIPVKYSIVTGKNTETGRRYFALQVEEKNFGAFVHEDGTLIVRLTGKYLGVLNRGDRNPFSK